MIEIAGVTKRYGNHEVLRGVDLTVARGTVTVICGPSGSGKSTLLRCINALEPFQGGTVLVDGVSVGSKECDAQALRRRIGMVFQSFNLYPHMTVLDNITLAPRLVLGQSRPQAQARARELLARVGIPEKAADYPGQLSGGQQQRVAIARALALDPAVMLFDEPTSALDPEMIKEVLDVMIELAVSGMTMIVVTHEMGFARRVAHEIVFMDEGRVVSQCGGEAFFNEAPHPRVASFLEKILH